MGWEWKKEWVTGGQWVTRGFTEVRGGGKSWNSIISFPRPRKSLRNQTKWCKNQGNWVLSTGLRMGWCSKHQLWNSWQCPIYSINFVDHTKLPCYTLSPTQHHKLTPFNAHQKKILWIITLHCFGFHGFLVMWKPTGKRHEVSNKTETRQTSGKT